MPDRILRKDILSSERVNKLDAPAEVFYRRLMNVVDDHGLFDARPSLLRSECFPIRETVRVTDISRWLAACQEAGLIVLYASGDKALGQMLDTKWPVRGKPKFDLPTSANKCSQPPTNAPVVVGVGVSEVVDGSAPAAPPIPRDAKGERLAADWTLPADWKAWAEAELRGVDAAKEAAKFADFWRAKPGKDGRKSDWLATWRNWIRGAKSPAMLPGGAPASNPGGISPAKPETPEDRAAAAKAHAEYLARLGYTP